MKAFALHPHAQGTPSTTADHSPSTMESGQQWWKERRGYRYRAKE